MHEIHPDANHSILVVFCTLYSLSICFPFFAKYIWVRIEKSRRVFRGGNRRRYFNYRERKGGKENARRGKARFSGEPLQVILAMHQGFVAIFAGLRSPTCSGFSYFWFLNTIKRAFLLYRKAFSTTA